MKGLHEFVAHAEGRWVPVQTVSLPAVPLGHGSAGLKRCVGNIRHCVLLFKFQVRAFHDLRH